MTRRLEAAHALLQLVDQGLDLAATFPVSAEQAPQIRIIRRNQRLVQMIAGWLAMSDEQWEREHPVGEVP